MDDLKNAAKETTAEVLKQFDKIDAKQFEDLISELRKNSVDTETISELEDIIKDSTRKNERLSEFIKRSGEISKIIMKTVCSLVKK
jgi:hypothetical protein